MGTGTMMLCNWHGYWFLSTGINRAKDFCAVRCGASMPHPDGFIPLPPIGIAVYGAVSPIADVVFYSRLSYHGMKVSPTSWAPHTNEPMLNCDASPDNLDDLDSEYFRSIRSQIRAQYPSQVLIHDGWRRPDKFIFSKQIHVDELEKIEGSPPEGAF